MRKVKIRDTFLNGDNTTPRLVLYDTGTKHNIVCPLTSNPCTPDCAAFEATEPNPPARPERKACCCWPKGEMVLVIGELVEEAKP